MSIALASPPPRCYTVVRHGEAALGMVAMARYGKETTLAPGTVLRLAREYFGSQGALGLAITKRALTEVVFEGGGGSVAITALPRVGAPAITDVTILSREYDLWAERFLGVLTDAERGPGPVQRLIGWFSTRGRRD